MRTKMTKWLDRKTMRPRFGIAVKIGDKWFAASENDNFPLFFDTEEECQKKRKEIRAIKRT